MIKIFKGKKWEPWEGTYDEAVDHIYSYLKEQDGLDCDNCWDDYVELFDSEKPDIIVFSASYSGWEYKEEYPAVVEYEPKEEAKKRWTVDKWQWYLTELDPRRDYILIR